MIKTLILEKLLLIRSHFSKSSFILLIGSLVIMMFSMSAEESESRDMTATIFPILLSVFSVMICSISDMHENRSKFGKYLLSAPAGISDLSAAKYLFTFLTQTASAAISAAVIITASLIHGNMVNFSLFSATFFMYGFSMTFYSIYNIISLKYSDDTANNITALIILGIFILALIYALFGDLEIISRIYDSLVSMSGKLPIAAAVYALLSLVFMFIGYFVSKKIQYIY